MVKIIIKMAILIGLSLITSISFAGKSTLADFQLKGPVKTVTGEYNPSFHFQYDFSYDGFLLRRINNFALDSSLPIELVFYYDIKNRCIIDSSNSHSSFYFYDDDKSTYFKKDYLGNITEFGTLNDQGLILTRKSSSSTTCFEYDSAGNEIKQTILKADGTFIPMTVNKYDDNKQLIYRKDHRGETITTYTYNENNWPTHMVKTIKNTDGKITSIEEFNYSYENIDTYGNWLKQTAVHENTDVVKSITTRKITYYPKEK